jgi:hypothetical protein
MDKVFGISSSSGSIGDDIRKLKNEMNMVGLFVGACTGVCGIAVVNAIKEAENTREISEIAIKEAEKTREMAVIAKEESKKTSQLSREACATSMKLRADGAEAIQGMFEETRKMAADSERWAETMKNSIIHSLEWLETENGKRYANVLEEVGKMRADIEQMPREYRELRAEHLRQMEMEMRKLEQIEASIRENLVNSHGRSSATAAGPDEAAEDRRDL